MTVPPHHQDEPTWDTDWFGHPIRPDGGAPYEPVPCPHCGERHTSRAAMAAHLAEVHDHRVRVRSRRRLAPRLRRWGHGLRFMPLWFVLVLNVLLTGLLLTWAGGMDGLVLYAEGDQLPVVKTWLVRLSMLPTVMLLAWRNVDRRV